MKPKPAALHLEATLDPATEVRQLELLQAILHRVDTTMHEAKMQTDVLRRIYALLEAATQETTPQQKKWTY